MHDIIIPTAYLFSGVCLLVLAASLLVSCIVRKDRKDVLSVIECIVHALTALVIGAAYMTVIVHLV